MKQQKVFAIGNENDFRKRQYLYVKETQIKEGANTEWSFVGWRGEAISAGTMIGKMTKNTIKKILKFVNTDNAPVWEVPFSLVAESMPAWM